MEQTLFWACFIGFIVIGIKVVMYFDKKRHQQLNNYKEQYFDALKSQDKSQVMELGKKYYEYGYCWTIFQQNNVLLKIQNDILLYSK
jgi:hypothetical protein